MNIFEPIQIKPDDNSNDSYYVNNNAMHEFLSNAIDYCHVNKLPLRTIDNDYTVDKFNYDELKLSKPDYDYITDIIKHNPLVNSGIAALTALSDYDPVMLNTALKILISSDRKSHMLATVKPDPGFNIDNRSYDNDYNAINTYDYMLVCDMIIKLIENNNTTLHTISELLSDKHGWHAVINTVINPRNNGMQYTIVNNIPCLQVYKELMSASNDEFMVPDKNHSFLLFDKLSLSSDYDENTEPVFNVTTENMQALLTAYVNIPGMESWDDDKRMRTCHDTISMIDKHVSGLNAKYEHEMRLSDNNVLPSMSNRALCYSVLSNDELFKPENKNMLTIITYASDELSHEYFNYISSDLQTPMIANPVLVEMFIDNVMIQNLPIEYMFENYKLAIGYDETYDAD